MPHRAGPWATPWASQWASPWAPPWAISRGPRVARAGGRRPRIGTVLIAVALAVLGSTACSKSERRSGGTVQPPAEAPKPTFTLFGLAEVRGQVGPCGCTTDPLGDLSRTARMIADARAAGPVLVVDAGSLLYSKDKIPPQSVAQEELKADLLAKAYREELSVAALGLGWADLPMGPGKVRAPRHAVNVGADAGIPLVPPAVLERQLAALEADLARFAADKAADPDFVRQKQGERDRLAAQRAELQKQPLAVPAQGSYFTLEQVRINKTRACQPKVQDAVTAFYRAAGEANAAAAAGTEVPPVPKGKAGFVGNTACEDCHDEAVKFWQKTRHASAWETLVQRGQQLDFDCIGCHVTGWNQPGGATLAINEQLRDVGCETCHGPGSIHVARGGEEKPSSVVRNPPKEMCALECHTKEHSDTFQYEAYLRDIVGPGHGEPIRTQLGSGPTGAELRRAGLSKAGKMGPGCVR